jgi:hypothetical protein
MKSWRGKKGWGGSLGGGGVFRIQNFLEEAVIKVKRNPFFNGIVA